MEAYAIFEGGGAKGYAHIGALKAAEERGITFRAVGGTSAGAIVAALVAVGYGADELLDLDGREPRGVLSIDPLTVLDLGEYGPTRALMNYAENLGLKASAGWTATIVGKRRAGRFARSVWAPIAFLASLAVRHNPAMRRLFARYGMNDIERVATWIENLLRAKTTPRRGMNVTFGDLPTPLKVVAADLARQRLRVFGGLEDRDVPVARAVAASACFPLFFEPLRMDGQVLVDGGVVSNHPAWIFDEERDADTRFLPTFGFRLIGKGGNPADAEPDGPVDFAKRLFSTLQTGAPGLQERMIDDYYSIDLTAPISSLAFNELPARAVEVAREGRRSVAEFFRKTIGPQDPDRMAEVLRRMIPLLRARYLWRDRVRASILLPQDGGRSARTTYSSGMERDGDDRLRIRLDKRIGAGAAFQLREPVYIRRDRLDPASTDLDRYELTGRPGDILFSYVLPIFRDPDQWSLPDPATRAAPFAALVIDREERMAMLNDPLEQDTLANLAAIIGEQVSRHRIVRTRHGGVRRTTAPVGSSAVDADGGMTVSNRKVRDVGDGTLAAEMGAAISDIDARGGWHVPAMTGP